MSEAILKANFEEYFKNGARCLQNSEYNSAATELFKAFITLCDIAIYRKLRLLPDEHNDRFGILKLNFPNIYKIEVSLFDIYRKTYRLRVSNEDAKKILGGVLKLAKIVNIKTNMQRFSEEE